MHTRPSGVPLPHKVNSGRHQNRSISRLARWRTRVDRLTPMTPAISSRVSSLPSLKRRAVASLAGVMRAGRPQNLPLARAASTPARERSTTISRSKCATAEKMWKTRRPASVVVWCRSLSGATANPRPARQAHPRRRSNAGPNGPAGPVSCAIARCCQCRITAAPRHNEPDQ